MVKSQQPFSLQDDQLLDGVARSVTSTVNHFFSRERLEHAAKQDERLRIARELHDGVLQALTGATLQLEALSRLIDENPNAARSRLRIIEQLINEEQRELRTWIERLKPSAPEAIASYTDVAAALETLCGRIERQWHLQVQLTVARCGAIPRTLGDEIYRIVQEALNNVARHARSEIARVNVTILRDQVRIVVTDDGCGFPFHGRYDLAELSAKNWGPASLKERIASLDGQLVVTSTHLGSELEIVLPLRHNARSGAKAGSRRNGTSIAPAVDHHD